MISIIDLDARDFVRNADGKHKQFDTFELAEDWIVKQDDVVNVQYLDWDGDGQ